MATRRQASLRPVVVKLGGSTLGSHDTSLRDIADARRGGVPIVVVHGGGAAISEALLKVGIEATFARGLRVTDAATLDVVVDVLARQVNKRLAAELTALGATAIGISGADGLLQARRYDDALGFVGKIHRVNAGAIERLVRLGYVPVIAPIAVDSDGGPAHLLNTNADTAAGEIAAALHAERLVFLTDVEGVLGADGKMIAHLTSEEATTLIASGVAEGGMVPKLEAAIGAASAGCATHILSGTAAGALAAALAGGGSGTTVGGFSPVG